MEPSFYTRTFVYPCQNSTFYNIKFSSPAVFNTESKDILVVIDKSGSMAGSSLDNTKTMMSLLLSHVLELKVSSFSLITYNDKAFVDFDMEKDPEKINKRIKEIKADGGTIFSKALDAITDTILKLNPQSFLSLVFLTDGLIESGYDTEGNKKHLLNALSRLELTIKSKIKNCEIHALGVKEDHDPFFLSSLVKLGTSPGTYQYIKTASDTQECFNNIMGILELKGFKAFLSEKELISQHKLDFVRNSEKEFEADGFLDIPINNLLSSKNLTLTFETQEIKTNEIILKPELIESKDKEFELRTNLRYCEKKISLFSSNFLSKIEKSEKSLTELETLAQEFKSLKEIVTSRSQECFRVHPSVRRELLEISSSLQKNVNFLEPIINAAFVSKVSNDIVAQVNALSFKEIINTKLKKRLDKRAQTTVKIINEAYDQIQENLKSFDRAVIEEKFKEKADSFGCCVLTTLNFVEAIFEGDSLCVTCHVTRSEVCLVDPSQLIINEIYPSLISANAFLDSVRYAMKINPVKQEPIKPGLENQGKKILKGAAAEEINACVPLFICNEHWRNAKLLMKPVLGWVVTTDPLGYVYTQKMNIPFLLLAKVSMSHLKEPNSEFHKQMFNRILETCLQIMRDDEEPGFGGTWRTDFSKLFRGYLTEAEVRCENIGKNEVFLVQAYCAKILGWLVEKDFDCFEKIFEKMCEEELRRNQEKWDENKYASNVVKILGISEQKIQDIVANMKSEEQKEEIKEKEESKGENSTKKIIKIKEILENESHNKEILKEIYKEYLSLYKNCCENLFTLKRLLCEKTIPLNDFKDLNITKDVQFLCLYLQNKTQNKIFERRKALKFNSYCDFVNENECIDFIEKIASSSIIQIANEKKMINTKGLQKEKMLKKLNVECYGKLGKIKTLTRTDDIEEAINLFQSIGKSSRIFYFYFFKRYPTALLGEKLEILMTGKHENKIVMYEWADQKFYPKSSIMRRILKQNKNDPNIKKIFF